MIGHPKQQPKRRPSVGARSKAQVDRVRHQVFERDEHTCAVAGLTRWPCTGALTVQHARSRGAGGSDRWDGPEWLRTLCSGHNTLDTADADFARLCLAHGVSVPSHGYDDVDMTQVPVRTPQGWFLLARDCTRTPITSSTARRLVAALPWNVTA